MDNADLAGLKTLFISIIMGAEQSISVEAQLQKDIGHVNAKAVEFEDGRDVKDDPVAMLNELVIARRVVKVLVQRYQEANDVLVCCVQTFVIPWLLAN